MEASSIIVQESTIEEMLISKKECTISRCLFGDSQIVIKSAPYHTPSSEALHNEYMFLTFINHPAILPAIGCIDLEDVTYLITPYCAYQDLVNLVQDQGAICSDIISEALYPIADAIMNLHQNGIIHRDIKPENIMIDVNQSSSKCPIEAFLGDFDLSSFFSHGEKLDGGIGSINTAAPEVLLGNQYDEKADVWSFGVTLYFAATAKYPYDLKDQYTVEDVERAMQQLQTSLQSQCFQEKIQHFKDLLTSMLAVEPEDRCDMEYVCNSEFFADAKLNFNNDERKQRMVTPIHDALDKALQEY